MSRKSIYYVILVVFLYDAVLMSAPARGQTGQALIANPLLSADKVKEVKRQILEAGHPELLQSRSSAPVSTETAGMIGGTPSDGVRRALSGLRVTAIVGDTAILASDLPSQNSVPGSAPGYAQGNYNPMVANNPGLMGQPIPAAMTGYETQQHQSRRAVTATLRHGVKAYVEGYEVMPFIRGGVVRLTLVGVPREVVYQASMQPAILSPSVAVQATALEKANTDYVNANKPDSTSMSVVQSNNAYPQGQLTTQSPNMNGQASTGLNYPR